MTARSAGASWCADPLPPLPLAARPETLLAMYETRDLRPGTYWSLAIALNQRYAARHGHAFRLFVPPDAIGERAAARTRGRRAAADCYLNGSMSRAASWCKRLAAWQESAAG